MTMSPAVSGTAPGARRGSKSNAVPPTASPSPRVLAFMLVFLSMFDEVHVVFPSQLYGTPYENEESGMDEPVKPASSGWWHDHLILTAHHIDGIAGWHPVGRTQRAFLIQSPSGRWRWPLEQHGIGRRKSNAQGHRRDDSTDNDHESIGRAQAAVTDSGDKQIRAGSLGSRRRPSYNAVCADGGIRNSAVARQSGRNQRVG